MAISDDYLYAKKFREYIMSKPMSHIFVHQEKRFVQPFRIYGNVYYVGDDWVCVHLIDTGDGLLMIDSGNCGTAGLLVNSIWEAGFRPADVKWIILSHGHIDHVGNARFFRDTWGSRIYLGEPDARMFAEHPEFSYLQDSPCVCDTVFEPDEVIRDGDELHFGKLTVSCRLVPGHTEGCTALFFDAEENGVKKRCGYYGGFGFNTLTKSVLREMGDTDFRMWKTYAASIDKVIDEPVDIFLGNHTQDNNVIEKSGRMAAGGGNPFINSAEWHDYLSRKKADLEKFILSENGKE